MYPFAKLQVSFQIHLASKQIILKTRYQFLPQYHGTLRLQVSQLLPVPQYLIKIFLPSLKQTLHYYFHLILNLPRFQLRCYNRCEGKTLRNITNQRQMCSKCFITIVNCAYKHQKRNHCCAASQQVQSWREIVPTEIHNLT